MPKKLWILFTLLICYDYIKAQQEIIGIDLLEKKRYVEIPFQYINGHIILDVMFHDIFPVKFIFDTGAQNTVLFEKSYVDVFGLKSDRFIPLRGADLTSTIQASIVRNVRMKLDGIKKVDRDILVLPTNFLKLEEMIGINVIGIIGAEFFRNLIIKIDYERQKLTLFEPNLFNEKNLKNFYQLPADFEDNKFYIKSAIRVNNLSKVKEVRLLMDTGASLSFLLNTNSDTTLSVPQKILPSILGQGLGGPILGYIGKVHRFSIDSFSFPNILTYFQDDNFVIVGEKNNQRNGLLGNQVLSRFTIFVEYFRGRVFMKPQKNYNKDFKYDLSGLTLHAFGPELNHFFIKAVLDDSPASDIGLMAGDEIVKVGFWGAWRYDLESLTAKLASKPGKKIKFEIKREGKKYKKELLLRDLFN